jgi:hypothetical protein
MKFKLAFAAMAVSAAFTTVAAPGREKMAAELRSASPGSLPASSSDAAGTKPVTITDPILNMKAYSMQRTAQSMNARSRAADDWCDYSLGLQKRLDPNTGLITKDSSNYNYTRVNEQGDRVQTNNINANPNGNGTGNWTLQENGR